MAPALEATTLTGQPATIADYRGNVVVLVFWGYWSEKAIATMPDIARLATRYRDSNVVVLGVHDATIGSATEYARLVPAALGGGSSAAAPFPVLLDAPPTEQASTPPESRPHSSGRTFAAYGVVTALPAVAVVDPTGHLAGGVIVLSIEEVERLIRRARTP